MQQTNLSTMQISAGNKNIVNELFGGLSIAPYGIFLLLSAYAFAQGWLNWETNGGPPYLGGVLAWLIDRLIIWFYRKKYNFSFSSQKSNNNQLSSVKKFVIILGVLGLLIAWFLDANFHPQIRLMPLWFGLFVSLRGFDWLYKRWFGYGLIHVIVGIIPIGMSIMPLILSTVSNNNLFGIEGIYELSAMGIVIILISILEHLIFISTIRTEFE